ncbi:hypothetical protein Ancab_018472 [Ancistrocladus abbreviatus]
MASNVYHKKRSTGERGGDFRAERKTLEIGHRVSDGAEMEGERQRAGRRGRKQRQQGRRWWEREVGDEDFGNELEGEEHGDVTGVGEDVVGI